VAVGWGGVPEERGDEVGVDEARVGRDDKLGRDEGVFGELGVGEGDCMSKDARGKSGAV
jgi:hypothetical protein